MKTRRVLSMFLCVLLISTAIAFFDPNIVVTDVSAEVVEGEGNCFQVTNSTYLNVTLCSSEVVNVSLESIPEVVSFTIENVTSAQSTEVTISGFEPNMTYYRHQDGYLMENFTADEDGNYSYTQDISEPHHVFIQEEAGTKYIKDDATGGDCNSIGDWVPSTKTCTLTSDVFEMIVIDSDGVTLDGDGHSVTYGTGSYGIYASWRSGITITNATVSGFTNGIHMQRSRSTTINGNTASGNRYYGIYLSGPGLPAYNTVSGNTVSGNYHGIHLIYCSSSTVSGNMASGNDLGIDLDSSAINDVSGNTVSGNTWVGINLDNSIINDVSGNTVSGNNHGINLAYSSSNNISWNIVSGSLRGINLYDSDRNTIWGNNAVGNTYGIYLDGSSSNTLRSNAMAGNTYNFRVRGLSIKPLSHFIHDIDTSNTVDGKPIYYWVDHHYETVPWDAGYVGIVDSDHIIVYGLTLTNNGQGILLAYTSNSTIRNVNVSDNEHGIQLVSSSSNNISGNIVSDNDYGICLESSSNSNTIRWNTVSGNSNGIRLRYSDSSTIFHNNLIDNANQLGRYKSTNTWNNGAGEGNYWSDYTGQDTNGDGVGDTDLPYQGVDLYPLMDPYSNTPVGTDVEVDAGNGVSVRFSKVTGSGVTYSGLYSGSPPANFRLVPIQTFYAIDTTASSEGIINISIAYDDSEMPPPVEGNLRLRHLNETTGDWDDITTWVDTENDIIYGETDHLSIFAIMLPANEPRIVTGGGWYWSSPGSYFGDPGLEGKVNFGFVAKYHKGADVPKGNTEFRFKAADMDFHSTSYEWLVIAGPRAQFKGTGTINGEGDYAFMLTVIDGDLPGGGGVDRIRMKIWDKGTGIMIYDTNVGMDDNTDPLTPLGGGQIKIHKG